MQSVRYGRGISRAVTQPTRHPLACVMYDAMHYMPVKGGGVTSGLHHRQLLIWLKKSLSILAVGFAGQFLTNACVFVDYTLS